MSVGGSEPGRLLAGSAVPTTVGPGRDVLTGLDAAVAAVVADVGGAPADVRVCSSAGGGLRLAVVGYERVVTAEAGATGGALGRCEGRARRGRPARRRGPGGAAGAPARTWCCSSAEPMAATRRCCAHNARGSRPAVAAGRVRGRGQHRRARPGRGRGSRAGRRTVVGCANVLPRIGGAGPGAGPRRDPRGVHAPRHRRQGPLAAGRASRGLVRARHARPVLAGVELLADGTRTRPGDVCGGRRRRHHRRLLGADPGRRGARRCTARSSR